MLTPEERIQVLKNNSVTLHTETLTCIKNALLSLMNEKAYDEITMTEIIRRSGASRGGVYNNYKDKDEILMDICQEPIDEALAALTNSIFDNMEATFRIGKKYEPTVRIIIAAGLEHEFLRRMNKRFESKSASFYNVLWNGMIFNAFIEWARAGMPGTVEEAIEKVNAGLKQVAKTIQKGPRNQAQQTP